ncbi:endonuclease/exonuclease/phosphatase family protein [Pelagibacterium luteolum]|uniref:Metal-dependent hydrolase, endonuclease/exonuclease/phosphatase family n=1 Tax=Pelagibacterium luteolum TaxID=440168 RepID=A0A1G7S3G9_9HYPH|nr:endonuclease/exonuclease/phosphatase family protein [Pelagibacterium luteolum]SDG17617.1 Metal-dependent hydrolase, endonuclease/exonuclease/phosphatase family [Pelagibacterium luteolum]
MRGASPAAIDCVTWNVHRGRGNDGQFLPERVHFAIETEIAPLRPHVLALQEADLETLPQAGYLDIGRIGAAVGLDYAQAQESLRRDPASSGFFGSVLFLHPDFTITATHVIDLPGHWHRGAVAMETIWQGRDVRIVTGHFSRLDLIRMAQMRTLGQFILRRPQMPTVLMGDINDWRYWRAPSLRKTIVGRRFEGPKKPTFPMERPFLPLDRIMSDVPGAVVQTRVLDGTAIRVGSDHRPLWGRVTLD